MGQNLILNAADHGFNVVAFNRTVSKVDRFLANEAKGRLDAQNQNFTIAALTIARQIDPGRPLHRGLCLQAQEAPSYDDARHGRQARRRLHRDPPAPY